MRTIEVNTAECTFRKSDKTLLIPHSQIGRGFPDIVRVTSSHTGRTVEFVRDTEAAIAAEFWDGEECHYMPVDCLPNVVKLVIHCAEF